MPQGALAWGGPGGRCARLLAEIGRHAPDVVALQEVDRFQDIWTALSAAGCALEGQIESGGSIRGVKLSVTSRRVDRFQGMWTALSAAGCALDMGFQHTAEQSDVCE